MMRFISASLTLAFLAGTIGCKSKTTADQTSVPAAAADPATLGQVAGTITLQGRAPAPVPIDTSVDPACGLSSGKPVSEQYVVESGKLANVFITIKSGPPTAMNSLPPATSPVIIDQKGCVYIPHVVALREGGTVEFHNDDAGMHNIETMPVIPGNKRLDTSQGPRGTPRTAQFPHAEAMIPVRCNMHPWMNAFINVSATPFFAVTDAAGHFTLTGLPPGDYTLAAVHEVLGEQIIPLTIKSRSTSHVSIDFAVR